MVNYYEILELENYAPAEEVDQAIKAGINKWRRRLNAPSPERQREASEMMERLQEARKTLMSEPSKTNYDHQLKQSLTPEPKETTGQNNNPNTEAVNEQYYQDLLDRFEHHFDNENYDHAAEVCRDLLKEKPKNPTTWHNLAITNLRRGNFPDARYEIEQALGLSPNNAHYYQSAHLIYRGSKDISKAMREKKSLAYIQKALEISPNEVAYKANLSSIYYDNQEYDRAINLLEGALKDSNLTPYGNEMLAISYEEKIKTQYMSLVSGSPSNRRKVFTNLEDMATAENLILRALKFAERDGTANRLRELEQQIYRDQYVQTEFKYLIFAVLAAIWFLTALPKFAIFQLLISGGIAYYSWTKFRVPVYKINAKLANG